MYLLHDLRAYLKNKAHAIYQKFDEIIYQNKLHTFQKYASS